MYVIRIFSLDRVRYTLYGFSHYIRVTCLFLYHPETELLTDSYAKHLRHKVFTSVQICVVFMWGTTPYKGKGGWTTNVSEGYKQ
jgi:hypothetical protein